jgi:predicted permease
MFSLEKMPARLLSYVRGIARRRRIEDEVDEELRFHIEQEIDAHVAQGVPPGEARRLALRDLGGITQTREAVRDVRTIAVDLLWRDLRHAVRALRRAPGFTAVALIVLTLSIGASTAIFSVVDATVLRALPFDESDRLVSVGERNIQVTSPAADGIFENTAAPQNFFDWRERQDVFSGLAAWVYGEMVLPRTSTTLPENVFVPGVTADFFSVLRVAPLLGRTFTTNDERESSARVAVISYDLWQRRFGGRPDVIGMRLRNQPFPFEIIGVMPPGFAYPVDTDPAAAWVPFIPPPDARIRGNTFGYYLHVVGRLRDGVSVAQAQARMDQITAALAAETPRWFIDRVARVVPLQQFLARGVRTWMMMLLAAVLFVLLIACVNLANLMLVRGTTRVRELGVRAALGASRWDLARTLLLESVVLSVTGAALGALLAWWSLDILRAVMPPEVPRVNAIAVDLRVLTVTMAAAIVTGIAFGIAPVVQFVRPAATTALNQSERTTTGTAGARRLRSILVVAEVALAVVLLVGAGLFLASFARVTGVDLGFDRREVLTVWIRVLERPADLKQFSERNRQLFLNVLERVRAVPGVEVTALLGQALPMSGELQTVNFGIPGRVFPPNTDIAFNQISPDYFRAVRIPLLKGRFFTDADVRTSDPVVILNEAAAAQYFPGVDPIGHVVRVQGTRTVVGVVGNIRHDGPEAEWRTQAFVPVTQSAVTGARLIVRTTPGARNVLPAVRDVVWSEFPDTSIPTRVDERTLSEYFDGLVARRRFNMLLLSLFGLLGLLIAAAGIYGVLSYVVTQKTPEIGVRMALGAQPTTILASVLRGAMLHVAIGLTIGAVGAWSLSTFVAGLLFEIRPHDPMVFAGVLAVLVTTAAVAAFVPARRASRIDPLIAMRVE